MKIILLFCLLAGISFSCGNGNATAQNDKDAVPSVASSDPPMAYYIDVHDLKPGEVKFSDVALAHEKDLATEIKYGVSFLRYWVDEAKGKVYCLSKAANAQSIRDTHKEAHGLMPAKVYRVSDGPEAPMIGDKPLYLDVHELGTVTAKDVAGAHEKDLAVEKSHDVNFINYWVDEKQGVVMCLSEAPDSNAVIATHKQAHGLLPAYVLRVKQGQ
jgi:hypothetical protein